MYIARIRCSFIFLGWIFFSKSFVFKFITSLMMILSSSYLDLVSPIDLTRSWRSLLKWDPDDIYIYIRLIIMKWIYLYVFLTHTNPRESLRPNWRSQTTTTTFRTLRFKRVRDMPTRDQSIYFVHDMWHIESINIQHQYRWGVYLTILRLHQLQWIHLRAASVQS